MELLNCVVNVPASNGVHPVALASNGVHPAGVGQDHVGAIFADVGLR